MFMKKYLISSELFINCNSMINFPSTLSSWIVNPFRIGLIFVLLNLCSNFREDLLFSSYKENPDSFVFHVVTWFSLLTRTKFVYGSLRSSVWNRTVLTKNFLHESDLRSAGSSRSWMKSGEDSAFPMVASSSSASSKYEDTASLSLDFFWKIISKVSD